MLSNERWLLPEGVEEVLPAEAERLERMRRALLDLYHSWGYELVMTPQIEFLESLLTGTGNDLELQTFKLTDQLSGRMMGLRADMTPQVARIDAHHLRRQVPTRLCYMGSVMRTLPDGIARTRTPLQVGAELYGHSGIESDVEVIHLMLASLSLNGIEDLYLDLGHVGIYRGLIQEAGLDVAQEAILFEALQRKARTEIIALLDEWQIPAPSYERLLGLIDLNGGEEVLDQAEKLFSGAAKAVNAALANLQQIGVLLKQAQPQLVLHYDLAELRGYHYHTGAVFAAYVPGHAEAVAQGGRYDDIGEVFGVARPATGFSSDLKTLAMLSRSHHQAPSAILAPAQGEGLVAEVETLRAQGERVVCLLPGQDGHAKEMGCDRQLIARDNKWVVEPL